ncbi:PQQ-binding-like beta-propeller repeat protein [Nonomuraea sp. NPDC047897]|uniref:outer membrane protein assembly factor BamB family protein n=1 Tax=Nonomuraea sp. NPDC047897 TaxID=3364346 RepID=UPI0037204288
MRRRALLVALALVAGSAVAADAPRLPTGWRALWSMPADVEDPEHPGDLRYAVSDEAIAVSTSHGAVTVHDPLTGRKLHTVPAASGGPAAPVAGLGVASGTLVVSRETPGGTGYLVSGHELGTGAPLWRRTVTTAATAATSPSSPGGPAVGLSVMVTEGGVTVLDRQADPATLTTFDLRTGRQTTRTTRPPRCHVEGGATSLTIMLLSSCAGDRVELASVDPRTLRPHWTRSLPHSVSLPAEDQADTPPELRLTPGADGYVYVETTDVQAFYSPEGRQLSTAREAVERRPPAGVTAAERWSEPLLLGSPPRISDRGFLNISDPWPLPAFLISLDTVTGRLGASPVDTPLSRAFLLGTAPGLAFVYDKAGLITAYQATYGLPTSWAPYGDVPPARWPDACTLLTGRDVGVAGDGHRPNPGRTTLAGVASPVPLACDWIPPTDDGAVVSLTVDWVFGSPAAARKVFATEVARIRRNGIHDPAYETSHAMTHTVSLPTGTLDESLVVAGPVLVRLASTSRRAVRLLTPLLQRNLLARYEPGTTVARDRPRRVRWSFPADGSVGEDLVLAGDTVYAGSADGNVYALDAASGVTRWRHQTGGDVSATPAVSGGAVYAHNDTGRIVSLDAASGRLRWSRRVAGSSGVVLAAGTAYACGDSSEVVALDAATGRPRWRAALGGDVLFATPSVAGGTVHVGSAEGTLYALDAASGRRRWHFRADGGTDFFPPVTSGSTVYVPTRTGHLHALDRATGRPRWTFRAGSRITAGPVVSGGAVYVGGGDGTLHKLAATTGRPSWDFAPGGGDGTHGGLVVDRGTVYLRHVNGLLYALDAASGGQRWSFPAGDGVRARPAVAHGVVYVGNVEGRVHALDARTGASRWTFRTSGQVRTTPVPAGGLVYVGSTTGEVSAIPAGG